MKNRHPAELALHQSVWTAWPSDADLWAHDLTPAREEVGAFIRAVDDGGNGEVVEVLAANEESARDAEAALKGTRARVHLIPFGDIWLRDTGPIFVTGEGRLTAVDFGFNGWGGKYERSEENTSELPSLMRISYAVFCL